MCATSCRWGGRRGTCVTCCDVFCVVCSFFMCVFERSDCQAGCTYVSTGLMNGLYVFSMPTLEGPTVAFVKARRTLILVIALAFTFCVCTKGQAQNCGFFREGDRGAIKGLSGVCVIFHFVRRN